ncbi:hypothetical protein E2562_001855 [Oryza meyeriana var. granulata]|uniref:Uncharacterized protein n=1 Tax=Oryza meyeriana var. granulata TaxID=110450 RepID=A0A6G1C4R8_9ORYZ|nr:hypothetical protein E2562_001855 [Oryza meyeriana var. granulata]
MDPASNATWNSRESLGRSWVHHRGSVFFVSGIVESESAQREIKQRPSSSIGDFLNLPPGGKSPFLELVEVPQTHQPLGDYAIRGRAVWEGNVSLFMDPRIVASIAMRDQRFVDKTEKHYNPSMSPAIPQDKWRTGIGSTSL